ncbi:MAG TPA: DUF2199 domain-containing protein [Longimicrobiaceae bacterium]|nr:DUF2199 domain-containing protein [Longimicrobiaceae bacterium]
MLCAKCGEDHPLEEMQLTFKRPDDAASLSPDERKEFLQENSDLCIIKGERFFIRAVLPLPVDSRADPYRIGLWVEVNQSHFERVYELWDSEAQLSEPPIPAIVANDIPITPGALGHPAELRLSGPSFRPNVILKPSAHPIYTEQSTGIDVHRIAEYTALFA